MQFATAGVGLPDHSHDPMFLAELSQLLTFTFRRLYNILWSGCLLEQNGEAMDTSFSGKSVDIFLQEIFTLLHHSYTHSILNVIFEFLRFMLLSSLIQTCYISEHCKNI